MIYTSSLSRIEKIIHEKYELSATIRHRGERGRQRENGFLVFLRENLPISYGVTTGEIFSFIRITKSLKILRKKLAWKHGGASTNNILTFPGR
jgi:hypothetical protein